MQTKELIWGTESSVRLVFLEDQQRSAVYCYLPILDMKKQKTYMKDIKGVSGEDENLLEDKKKEKTVVEDAAIDMLMLELDKSRYRKKQII